MSLLCYQLVRELESSDELRATLVNWQRNKGGVPGFGHPLYPAGDVRAKALFQMLKKTDAGRSRAKLVAQACQFLRKPATIHFALAALARPHYRRAEGPCSIL